jgi:hypothetical protein
VLGGLVSAAPASADEPGDSPTDWDLTKRISLGAQARKDRCQAGHVVHYGGPELKSIAASKLTGTDADLGEFVTGRWGFLTEWTEAAGRDRDAGITDLNVFRDRQDKLNASNKPYADVNSTHGGGDY